MGRIFCLCGKSSTGKDTIFRELLKSEKNLKKIVTYTTRPIRKKEKDGEEYHFVTEKELEEYRNKNLLVECRTYNTVYGPWHYFTVDENFDTDSFNYLLIGTLEAYLKLRQYFGAEKVVPIYVDLEDGERLRRALNRERKQKEPRYREMCRRFLADSEDFSPEKLEEAGIGLVFENDNLEKCLGEIREYINGYKS